MKKSQSRRDFLKAGTLTGSLLVLPGGLSNFLNPEGFKNLQGLKNSTADPVSWFLTGGETIYHLKAGKTSNDVPRSLFAAAFSGKIFCYDLSGIKLWENAGSGFFPFAMDAGDLDGDGFDECVIASADGSLYILDHDGTLIAKVFSGKPPLYAVKIVKDSLGNPFIYCGGPERVLYKVSPLGSILSQVTTTLAITTISSGNFTVTSGVGLVVGTQANYAKNYISIYNLPALTIVGSPINTAATYLYTMTAADIDTDASDRIAFGGNKVGSVYNTSGAKILTLQEKTTGRGQDTYAMQLLDSIPAASGTGRQLIGLVANCLRIYGSDGTIQKEVAMEIAPAGIFYDDASETLFLGSEMSGGDTIYCVRMNVAGWENALKTIGYRGKLSTIVSNINALTAQINSFVAPTYQPAENTPQTYCFTYNPYNPGLVSDLAISYSLGPVTTILKNEFNYPHIHFSGNQWLSENWDRSALPEGWATKRDPRMPYAFTSQQIIDYAALLEQNGLSFTWTIGHGNDPFFLSLATVEGILLAAPTKCDGFIFPEMEAGDTPAFRYAVENHIIPICNLCLKYGNRKVILRSKFLFWAADIHTSLWNWAIKDKKYKDVIVPAMEETYERICDLSISGRVGLKQGGWFNDWAGRAVHDNPLYDRQHQWSATTIGSHFLRALCYQSGMGARINLIQLGEILTTGFRGHSLIVKPFIHMLGKGILPCPQNSEDMLSLSPVAMGMKPASATFISASHNSHQIAIYASDPKWVLSRLECFWGQSPTPEHDFAYFGTGRRKQALNFVPKNPYGLVPVHPDDGSALTCPGVEKVISTDGEFWYDESGVKRTATEYAAQAETILKNASENMFVQVTGDVAWTATRLDNSHVRLVLIDSGYLDPMDRAVSLKFKGNIVSAKDILSKTNLSLNGNILDLTVPMGVLRIIDIEHAPVGVADQSDKKKLISLYPNPCSDTLHIHLIDNKDVTEIEIFDVNGKSMIHIKNNPIVDVRKLEKGTYTVKINSGTSSFVSRIVKV